MSDLSHPDSKKGRLQRACLEMLQAHEREGALPTNGRFIFYELEGLGTVSKEKTGARRPGQDVTDALLYLREIGLIPWEWIVDETREMEVWSYADNIAEYLLDTIPQARIDLWDGEPPPVTITESRSLSGVLRRCAALYLTPITSTNGQARGHLHTEVAPLLVRGQRVLYFGDFDWQGGQIEENTRHVLEQLVGPLDWIRLAITEAQVQERDLPIIQKPDRRYKPVRYHAAVETEALGQTEIIRIFREALNEMLPETLKDVLEREERQRQPLIKLLQGLWS